jgi:hypothetical protein
MTEGAPGSRPARGNRKAIPVTCALHRGPQGFANPVGIPPRWGLSSLDWHVHAVDEDADHPCGVYLARCGHQLRKANTLYDDPPSRICPSCARWSSRGTPPRGAA